MIRSYVTVSAQTFGKIASSFRKIILKDIKIFHDDHLCFIKLSETQLNCLTFSGFPAVKLSYVGSSEYNLGCHNNLYKFKTVSANS